MHPKQVIQRSSRACARRRQGVTLCFACIVLVALVLSIASIALAATSFPDVPRAHPYHGAIRELASLRIINGYENGNFGPEDPVTRQQFAKMIIGTTGYPVSESDVCPFTDVVVGGPDTFFPDNFVAVCAAKGITTGTTATTYDPYANISRYQVVSMVVRAADGLQPGLLTPVPGDVTATGGWGNDPTHGANAARAEYNGLLMGLDMETLNPYENMPRGEVAQVLHGLIAKLTYASNSLRTIYYYGLNINQPPLDNHLVRQALALAIDRQAIIDTVGATGAVPATGLIPPGIPGFDLIRQDFLKATAQVDQARDLLTDAGYPNGVGLPEITIWVYSFGVHPAVAEAIKEQWEEIGVNATIEMVPFEEYWGRLASDPDLMVYRMGFVADFNDAWDLFNLFWSGNGGTSANATNWTNAAYDQLLADALLAASPAEASAAYAALERILSVEALPIIPIYWY